MQLRANFQAINGAFAQNHVGLTRDQTIAGMHNMMNMNPQSADPTTSATQIALYNKIVGGVPNMFFRPASSATPIQMTYNSVKADGTNSQYSFLAGPFIIFAGEVFNQANNATITLSQATTLIFVNMCASADPVGVTPTFSGNVITIKLPVGFTSFTGFYLAVGIP